jgi:hypothetical protein
MEVANRIADKALLIFGGASYIKGMVVEWFIALTVNQLARQVVAIVIWVALVLRYLNVPQFEARMCQTLRAKSRF